MVILVFDTAYLSKVALLSVFRGHSRDECRTAGQSSGPEEGGQSDVKRERHELQHVIRKR